MRLVQEHIIKSTNKYYKDLMHILHLSKNLYNAALYNVRQYYFQYRYDNTVKYKYLNYYNNWKLMKETNNTDFKALEYHIAQQVIRQVDNNFSSFFALLKKKLAGCYDQPIHIPYYLSKNGYNLITLDQFSKKQLEQGYLIIPKTDIKLYVGAKVKDLNIKQIKLIPVNESIKIEFIYEVKEKELKKDNKRYMSIDLGVNNLCAISSNVIKSELINGKNIKTINQFYNKQVAHYKSKLQTLNNQYYSHRLYRLNSIRNNKIKDYFHKVSKYIVNQAVDNQINTIIIGHTKGWKQETNIGSANNQNFVQIPFNQLINLISYKATLQGINIVIQEESYTSKASFIDNDFIPTYDKSDTSDCSFAGKRIHRGLYKSNSAIINADINGSLNIMRKYLKVNSDDLINPGDFRGFVFNPKVIQL